MNQQMELFLSKLDEKLEEKLNQQTNTITTAVTANVMEALDDKIKQLMVENQNLKDKVEKLEQKITNLENDKRKNNLIFFGVEEIEKREAELVDHIKDTIEDAGIHIESHEINNVRRIGAQTGKNRPVIATISTVWKKHLILKAKSNLPAGVYVKEDFSREILEARKQLQLKVDEERKKGNIAFLRGDRLVIKKQDNQREKRKRDKTISPNLPSVKKPNTTKNSKNQTNKVNKNDHQEILKPSILQYMGRDRTNSTSNSENSKN
ncbi:hypothetical protein B5X24_HaOG215614 [Helicoverpa armigera]|nr:hypothetical protein B5X24_HaOG215614 [Helicoverpa armigera]